MNSCLLLLNYACCHTLLSQLLQQSAVLDVNINHLGFFLQVNLTCSAVIPRARAALTLSLVKLNTTIFGNLPFLCSEKTMKLHYYVNKVYEHNVCEVKKMQI